MPNEQLGGDSQEALLAQVERLEAQRSVNKAWRDAFLSSGLGFAAIELSQAVGLHSTFDGPDYKTIGAVSAFNLTVSLYNNHRMRQRTSTIEGLQKQTEQL